MSKRTNGTNRVGARLGLNKYKIGVPKKQKGCNLDALNKNIAKKMI